MKADRIFKNANIFTSDKDRPQATALAVKDGKFVYVGDEAGLAEYEGEVARLVTEPMSVAAMHETARRLREQGAALFFAAIRD